MRAELGITEYPLEGNAVADQMQVAVREIDDANTVRFDPGLVRLPLVGDGPVETARAGGDRDDLERRDLGEDRERATGPRTRQAPREWEQVREEPIGLSDQC